MTKVVAGRSHCAAQVESRNVEVVSRWTTDDYHKY